MKNMHERLCCLRLFVLISSIAILFSSCDSYNFSQPQPFDKANIYEFPDEFFGKWKEPDTATYGLGITVPLKGKEEDGFGYTDDRITRIGPYFSALQEKQANSHGSSFYYITRYNAALIISEEVRIVTGAWPKLKNGKELIYPPGYYWENNVFKTIKYDSLYKPIDTVDNYFFNKDKIYEIDSDRFLKIGYRYYVEKDTIIVLKNDTIWIDLGQNAFLRKLNDKLYAFNINNRILGYPELDKWWRIIILEKNEEGKLVQWECSSKAGKLPCMFYDRPSKSDIFFFDCQWSSAEMLRLIKDGYFETSSVSSKIGD